MTTGSFMHFRFMSFMLSHSQLPAKLTLTVLQTSDILSRV